MSTAFLAVSLDSIDYRNVVPPRRAPAGGAGAYVKMASDTSPPRVSRIIIVNGMRIPYPAEKGEETMPRDVGRTLPAPSTPQVVGVVGVVATAVTCIVAIQAHDVIAGVASFVFALGTALSFAFANFTAQMNDRLLREQASGHLRR